MLVIKFNGIYYFKWAGMYWLMWVLFQILTRAHITPDPGIEIVIQLSRDGIVTNKRRVFWQDGVNDGAIVETDNI